jgi:beta-mannosidase
MAFETQAITAWRLKDFDLGGGEAANAFSAAIDAGDWIDIPAPGDVYLALHAAGRLPDPIGDRTEDDCAWVRDREWWQRADFDAPSLAPGQRLMLTFEGLDTFATVWLNGRVVGRSDNMFRALELDITALLGPGRNTLAVRFTPPSTVQLDEVVPAWPGGGGLAESKRNFVRKAQFGWGWDWGPNLPTVGIWKPVTLAVEQDAVLRSVKFTTLEITPARNRARVSVGIEAEAFDETSVGAPMTAEVVLTAADGAIAADDKIVLNHGKGQIEFDLHNPELWWTPELGAASLYTLTVTLKADGEITDRDTRRVGVRTIELDTSPDADEAPASFFRFVLNGVSIFARGACWIPASSFVATVDEAHYRRLLEPAVRANMNMMRIWGGGVYEHAAFYDLCDQLGLLVWQDFMFACAPYPEQNPAFVANVDAEVRFQIKRLRNHACIALWCGNNENQVFHALANAMARRDDPLPGDLYYSTTMPAAVAELDPTTPYWPGSPDGGAHPNSMLAGDVHDWTVWHGVPPVPVDKPVGKFEITPESVAYTRYAEDMARFVSEYGIQASPVMETINRAVPPDQRFLASPGLIHRLKDRPKNKVDAMLIPVTGLPTNLDDYVDFTQIMQAEGLKFGVEHFRRRTPHCSGSLIWQYNDCWPAISWSLVDYNGFGKASYFYVARAYAPVMASFKAVDDGGLELWIVNDGMAPVSGVLDIALHAFDGGAEWSEAVEYNVPATTSARVWSGEVAGSPGHVISVTSPDGIFPANRHFFAPIKDLDRADPPAPDVRMEALSPNEVAVHITAKTYTWFVHLLVADEATIFSDNYVDIPEGETKTVLVRNAVRPLGPDDITVRWR